MKRILLALLLCAAPALAHDRERDHDDGDDWSDHGYGDESQSWDDSDYRDRGPTFDDFRNDAELSWNGEWIHTPEYGTVWRPRHVSDDWQPYVYGRWVWTRAGWAWASDEPFGWAVYHYGRWAWSPAFGWMWVPGRIWAPAWVSWRWSDGYAAWCPLGPGRFVERPAFWIIVPTRHFLEPVRHYVVPRPQRGSLPLPSRPGPRAGPAVALVERATGRSVRPLAINDGPTPSSARATSGTVTFYRPRTAPVAAPPRGSVVPRATPQVGPRATPQSSRPNWYGVSSPAAQRPHATSGPVRQAPQAAPASGPKAVAPRATIPNVAPDPRAAGPRASGPRQIEAKER
jgi:hypothetical protein